jgi:hypothetical protein
MDAARGPNAEVPIGLRGQIVRAHTDGSLPVVNDAPGVVDEDHRSGAQAAGVSPRVELRAASAARARLAAALSGDSDCADGSVAA